MAIEKITVPDLGEASDVEVIELLVNVGLLSSKSPLFGCKVPWAPAAAWFGEVR